MPHIQWRLGVDVNENKLTHLEATRVYVGVLGASRVLHALLAS
jgi:hypothetical protein